MESGYVSASAWLLIKCRVLGPPQDPLSETLRVVVGPDICTVASSPEVIKAADFGNPGGSGLVHRLWAPVGTSDLLCGSGESTALSDPCFSLL